MYIGQTIQSVLEQTFQDFELVIVDNSSPDNTQEVVKSFSDARIKYFRNNTNIGMVKNWNRAILLATGDYISMLHSDDFYLPGILEVESKILDLNPNVGLVYSDCEFIDKTGKQISVAPSFPSDYIKKGVSELKKLLLGNYMPPPTVMVRKECYKKLGEYRGDYSDYEMWMRICLYYDIAYISKILACYRVGGGSDEQVIKAGIAGKSLLDIAKNFLSNLPPSTSSILELKTKVLPRHYLNSACNYCLSGKLTKAKEDLVSAILEYPSLLQNPNFVPGFVRGTFKCYLSRAFLSTDYISRLLDSFLSININSKEIINKLSLDKSPETIRKLIGSYYYNWGRFLYFEDEYKRGLKLLWRAFLNNPFDKNTWILILKSWICLILPEKILSELRLLNRNIKDKLSRMSGKCLCYPRSLVFLMQDKCNARCVMCGLAYAQNERPSEITLERYIKIINNAEPNNIKEITFSGGGEPLLNKDFESIVTYTRERLPHVKLFIFTNAIKLDQAKARLLIENRFKRIVISINATSPQSYHQIMGVDMLDRVVQNVGSLMRLKKEHCSNTVVRFSFVAWRQNIEELPRLIETASKIGINEVVMQYCRFYSKRYKVGSDDSIKALDKESSLYFFQELSDGIIKKCGSLAKRLNIDFYHHPLFGERIVEKKCDWPWRALLIGPDGEVFPCGGGEVLFNRAVSTGRLYFGNLLKQNIVDFWNNRDYRKLRKSCSYKKKNKIIQRCYNCNSSILWLGANDPRSHFINID